MKHLFFKFNKYTFPCVVFSFLFGLTLIFVQKVIITNGIFSTNDEAYIISINFFDIIKLFVYSALTYCFLLILETVTNRIQILNAYKERVTNIKLFFALMLILLICWLPCLLTFYPGGIYSDTVISLAMANGTSALNNHNPILYTLSWQAVLSLAHILNQSEYLGLFMYTCFQSLAMAATGAYFLYSLYKKGFSKGLIILSLAYLGLFNIIPLYLVSLWKDTPFAIIVFLFSTFLFNIFWNEDNENKLFSRSSIFIYCFLAYLLAFARNNGFYVFVLFSVIIVIYFAHRKVKKLFYYSLVLSIILISTFSIIRGPIYSYLHYNNDDIVESLGIPIQQIAYVIANDGNVSDADLEYVNSIIPIDNLKNEYHPMIVDRLKWSQDFHKEALDGNVKDFAKTYASIIFKNPSLALKGFLLANEGFWDPTSQTSDGYVCNYMWPGISYEMQNKVQQWFGFSLSNDYTTSVKYSSAFFAWLVFGTTVLGFKRRHGGSYIPLIPALGIWLTMLIATPLAFSLRYMFPLVLLIPLGIANMCAPKYNNTEVSTAVEI